MPRGSIGRAVGAVDRTGASSLDLDVTPDAAELAEMRRNCHHPALASEPPSGLIVDALPAAGHPGMPIRPDIVPSPIGACQRHYRAAGGTSDPGNVFMLADVLDTDGHRFRPVEPCSDDIEALRVPLVGRDDLVAERVCPTARRRAAPADGAETEVEGGMARTRAAVLEGLVAGISARIEHSVAALPDGRIVMSFSGEDQTRAGRVSAARVLAERGTVRERFATADQLAAETGVGPLTRASSRNRSVVLRWPCNHCRRPAITGCADNAGHDVPRAADLYQRDKSPSRDDP